jgi:Mg-chelatase subunit ChlD
MNQGNQDIPIPLPPKQEVGKELSEDQSMPAPNIEFKNSGDAPNQSTFKNKKINPKVILVVGGISFFVLIFALVGYFIYQKSESFGELSEGLINKDENDNSLSESTDKKSFSILGGSSCQESYDELLESNSFDFNQYCSRSAIRSGNFEQEKAKEKTNNMVLIFDSSGSMAAQIDGKRKIDIAKNAAKGFIDKVSNDKNFSLSIIVYGHKGGNSLSQKGVSCSGIEEAYYMNKVYPDVAKSKIDNFNAIGWTPIASSIKKASEILSKNSGDENFVLLVSDGEETCGGDPVATVKELKNKGLNITANVVGFDVGGKDEQQLKAIATAGGGDYFSAKNEQDLEAAFEKHKEMLNTADFKIGRIVEQLYDISFVINIYNSCLAMLKKEEISMMLDIHASKLAGEKCEEYADEQYRKRYDETKNTIEENYKTDKEKFDQLKS